MEEKEMFMMEAGPVPGGEKGMSLAKSLDDATDEATMAASPTVTVKARTVKAMTDTINKIMTSLSLPTIVVEARDLEDEPMPLEIIKALQMLNAAYYDYADEDAVSFDGLTDDKGALMEVAKLSKLPADKGFMKFMKSESVTGGKAKPMPMAPMEEEEEEEYDDDMLMSRMS